MPRPKIDRVRIARRTLELTNLDKPLYPNGFTKAQIIDYYTRIAPVILPHLRKRGVTIKLYPRGTLDRVFFEKECPPNHPPWIKTSYVRLCLNPPSFGACRVAPAMLNE